LRKKHIMEVLQHSSHVPMHWINECVFLSVLFLYFMKFKGKPTCLKNRYTPPRRANMFLMPMALIQQITWQTCFLVRPTLDKWSSTELVLLIAVASLSARSLPANSCISLIWNVHSYTN
jgi:hypothetical protein